MTDHLSRAAGPRPLADPEWGSSVGVGGGMDASAGRLRGSAGADAAGTPAESSVRTAERLVAAVSLHHGATVERLLAVARVVVSVVMAVAIAAPEGPGHYDVVHVLSGAYAAFAVGIGILLWQGQPFGERAVFTLHVADFLWSIAIVTTSGGVGSHAYPLFAYVLISSAYRWGLRRTLIDGAIVVVLSVVEVFLTMAGWFPWTLEPDLVVVRLGYITVLAVLFGVMSEAQLALRFQALAIGGLMSRLGENTLVVPALRSLLAELIEVFQASRAVLVVTDQDAGAPALWMATKAPSGGPAFERRLLQADERHAWLFPWPPSVTACELTGTTAAGDRGAPPASGSDAASASSATMVLDAEGAIADIPVPVPAAFVRLFPWQVALAATVMATPRWSARVYVFDPHLRPRGFVRLNFLYNLARQLGAPLLNLHLLRRLRLDAASSERGRVARELHDGAIQTLVGLEMRLEVLRRGVEEGGVATAAELSELQTLTRTGAADLRELIQQLRPVAVAGKGLGLALADMVHRFGRDQRLEALFEWAAGRIEFEHRQSHEIYRLVQESLVNIRRHSGATRVLVRLEADADGARLMIEDNGKGLGFTGQMTHEQLAASHKGPRVLRERLEHMGGRLAAISSPAGTRLEMTFPHETSD